MPLGWGRPSHCPWPVGEIIGILPRPARPMSPRTPMLGAARRGERQQRRSNSEKQNHERRDAPALPRLWLLQANPVTAHPQSSATKECRRKLIRRKILQPCSIRELRHEFLHTICQGANLRCVSRRVFNSARRFATQVPPS